MSTLKTVCHFFFDNLSRCAFFAKQQVFKRIISAFAEYIPTGVEGLGFNSLPDKCKVSRAARGSPPLDVSSELCCSCAKPWDGPRYSLRRSAASIQRFDFFQ